MESKPWFDWMETVVKTLYDLDLDSMMIAAKVKDGSVLTAYYNADASDKALMVHNVQADIVLDLIQSNAGAIKEMLEDED